MEKGAMTDAFSSCSSTFAPLDAVRPPSWRCRHQHPACNEPNPARCQQRKSSSRQSNRRLQRTNRLPSTKSLCLVRNITLSLLCCVLLLSRGTHATSVLGASEALLPRELLFDRGAPSPGPRMHLEARNEASDLASTTIRPSGSATATGSVEVATETSTVIPRPFDSNIGNNFTTSTCPTFFDRFLNDQTFADCLPLSLLLQTSNGFFTASRSRVRLTTTLDSTCNVDFPRCSALMAGLAQEVRQNSNCGSDFAMGNPTVMQAYNGFVAYDTLYHAGCLSDADGGYCYANAVTNASAPTSSYIYYLPLGVQLPGGSRPACTACLQNTMAIFAQAAANVSQPLNGDYASAAAQVQMGCGPTFVQASVQTSSAATSSPRANMAHSGLVLPLLLSLWMVLFAA